MILCILKDEITIKMHKIISFTRIIFLPEFLKKNNYVCLPYTKFSDPLPETHFLLGLIISCVTH